MIRAALTVEEALEGMKALEPKIKNYARLVVRKGVNVKPGQEVVIAEFSLRSSARRLRAWWSRRPMLPAPAT